MPVENNGVRFYEDPAQSNFFGDFWLVGSPVGRRVYRPVRATYIRQAWHNRVIRWPNSSKVMAWKIRSDDDISGHNQARYLLPGEWRTVKELAQQAVFLLRRFLARGRSAQPTWIDFLMVFVTTLFMSHSLGALRQGKYPLRLMSSVADIAACESTFHRML